MMKKKNALLLSGLMISYSATLFSPTVIAKSCNAASAQGRGGLNCGPAPTSGSVGQTTGQVSGTHPAQVGSPTIPTSNQHPPTQPPISTLPPKAPIEGPKADPVLSPGPAAPAVTTNVMSGGVPPVAPITITPVATQQLAPVVAPPQAPPTPVPQQIPMLIPPIVQQTVPQMPPPMVPQQIPVLAPPTPMPQQTPMLIPPIVQQTTPDMPPPMAPQQVPVAVPVPVVMNVPPAPGSPPSRRVTPNKPMPMTSVSYEPVPATPYVTPRPQPLGRTTAAGATSLPQLASGTAAPATTAVATSSVPVTKSKEPALVVTTEAATASQNEKLITVSPGRQAANNYPSFNVDSNTPNRTCVVSGFERRKTVGANGVETYQGTLPSFRMVVTEVADLPAWHPLDAGCVISVTHKR